MNDTFNKETVSFYMVALASALASVTAMCVTAFWRATGSIAVGFAILLPAVLLACFGFAYPSPLNKVRCAVMMANTLTLGALFAVLFIITDLAGAKAVFYTVAGVFRPNAVGILLTVFAGLGLVVATLTVIRVAMHAFGKSFRDIERQLAVRSAEPTATLTPQDVEPRRIDERQVLAKADQAVRMSRMAVVPTENARPAVPAHEPRAKVEATPRQEEERMDIAQEAARLAQEEEQEEDTYVAEPDSYVVEDVVEAPQQTEDPVYTILPKDDEDATPVVQEEDDESTDAEEEPTVEVAMAQGDPSAADARIESEIRTDMVGHRPRQKEASTNDDLYTDFSYSGDDDDR